MLIDAHAHLVTDDPAYLAHKPPEHLMRAEDLLDSLHANGLHAAVAVQRAHVYGYDNSYVLDSARHHPDRLRAMCVIDAQAPDADKTVHDLADRGAAAIRLTAPGGNQLTRRTGWGADEIMRRVELRVTTLADKGCLLVSEDGGKTHVDAVPAREVVDPTGVGGAFRAGFIAGIGAALPAERAAQLGSLIATLVLETSGTQEWRLDVDAGLQRLADTYGVTARDEIEPVLRA
jgi:sugar/nucleoside kinase (ribokinase family)